MGQSEAAPCPGVAYRIGAYTIPRAFIDQGHAYHLHKLPAWKSCNLKRWENKSPQNISKFAEQTRKTWKIASPQIAAKIF